ncbi:UDP:flavonoid glycosyltransferase YjiC (YdhE family) [Crossiella equi]|uniref:UDP:flavonoid glycosyltransferase YjiC (YdhE family) n=1 Tax=Crossiella equi TaxID=130796 RepID=A0ABS5AML8_9PSEU|nr:nucleotide disphospho-sugar-binding domain-containing protein [Crossiella equi]MBP2477811.1 UDP:flavonoid glycosyltransferase YjiC (YdhE family) [Crossiella equi]
MRIVVITAGTRGDTAPFVGLGHRLRREGHEVSVAAQKIYQPLVTEAGLGFRELPGDIREGLSDETGQGFQRNGTGLRSLSTGLRFAGRLMSELAQGVRAAVADAELVLTHRLGFALAFPLARRQGIPSVGLELFPSGAIPSGEIPPVVYGGRSLGRLGNLAGHAGMRLLARGAALLPEYREFMREVGISGPGELFAMMARERWPVLHGWSPHVLPRPADWPERAQLTGYWWPYEPRDYTPPEELAAFLAAGPPPVFLSFGSMSAGKAGELSELAVAALREAGVRGVVQAGWQGLAASGPDVLSIGEVPHGWLFPRMAAVVHHGGAGTTGAGVRAGVPAVVVPVLGDQPLWAARLAALGVSPGSVPMRSVTATRLGALIRDAVTGAGYRRRAAALGERVRAEDGAGAVVARIRHLWARS